MILSQALRFHFLEPRHSGMPALDGQQVGLAGFPATEKKAILAKIKKLGATAALIISKKVRSARKRGFLLAPRCRT